MNRPRFSRRKQPYILFAVATVMIAVLIYGMLLPASGIDVERQTLQVGAGSPGKVTTYNLSFDTTTSGILGSVRVQFCSNSPLINRPCTAPSGFDVSQATLVSQAGPGGFSIDASTDASTLIMTRTPSIASAGTIEFRLNNVTNPSDVGSYYARIYTYPTADASGAETDAGGLAFAMTNEITLNAEVPPYLMFCTGLTITGLNCETATGDYIDFGELSPRKASRGSSQMLVATNAANGYSITGSGTTLTSGNNEITQLAGGDISRPGVGQFGFNLRSNSTPAGGSDPFGPGVGVARPGYNTANSFRFVNGESVAGSPAPDDKRQYTVSYLVNVPVVQPAGIYVTTITYVCLANF